MRRRHHWWFLGCLALIGAGCATDGTAPRANVAESQFWSLTLNAYAVTLSTAATYNTVQLAVTARDADGKPLTNVPPARFSVIGGTSVTVNSTGLVRARQSTFGTPAKILVQQTIGRVTHEQLVLVQVTEDTDPPTLATLTLGFPAGMPPVIRSEGSLVLRPTPLNVLGTDKTGNTLNLLVKVQSSDPTIATIDTVIATGDSPEVTIHGRRPGSVMITATTRSYGVTKQASMQLTVGPPDNVEFNVTSRTPRESKTPVLYISPSEITVSVGGVVLWKNSSEQKFDVTFDDPTAATAVATADIAEGTKSFLAFVADIHARGNIVAVPSASEGIAGVGYAMRYFARPGKYTFHSRAHPSITGTLVVQDL